VSIFQDMIEVSSIMLLLKDYT